MTVPVLRLYVRGDCKLCDDMKEQLKAVRDDMGFSFEVHDIDRNAELRDQYDEHVPVLMWGRDIICFHQFDKNALARALSAAVN